MFDQFIDSDRLTSRLDDLWEIGRTTNGGVTRLAYSSEETRAIEYILSELPDEYEVRTDSIGNVFATRFPDADQSLYLGSHLDTVYNGGRLDGTLGVVTALEAIEAVHRSDVDPPTPPTLTIFRGEESARFGQHTIGSRGALGLLTTDALASTDDSDIPVWQAMQRAGFRPDNLSEPSIDLDRVAGFLEVHIEQSRILDEADERIGVVTSIRAPVRYDVTVTGEYDHSGATPMNLRNDALAGAAEMITAIEEIGTTAAADGDLVATVGNVNAVDGAINTVCGTVEFPIDIRSNDVEYRDEIEARVRERIDAIAAERDIEIEADLLDRSEPVELDPDMIELLDSAAEAIETPYRRLPSGGGHDAMNFQQVGIPTGMVFTPSQDGISHSPKEQTPREAIADAARVLAHAIADL
jgi:hydantoinase/carbamoylase family amidase